MTLTLKVPSSKDADYFLDEGIAIAEIMDDGSFVWTENATIERLKSIVEGMYGHGKVMANMRTQEHQLVMEGLDRLEKALHA